MWRKSWPIIISLFIFGFLVTSAFVLAQDQSRPLEIEYPEIGGLKLKTIQTGLPEYVKYIFNLSLLIGSAILFGVLIYSGIRYIFSRGNVPVLVETRRTILLAFFGLCILFSSYLILITINPNLSILEFKLPQISFCKENSDCPTNYRCTNGYCEYITTPCQEDVQCPGFPNYICDKEKQTCVYNQYKLILQEIPLGQLLEEDLWNQEIFEKTKSLLFDASEKGSICLEEFLTSTITIETEKFNRISDLNKYLKSLLEECTCEGPSEKSDVTAIVSPNNLLIPGTSCRANECTGDPCKGNRKIIDQIVKVNKTKIEKINDFIKKIKENRQNFEKKNDRFFEQWEIKINCKETGQLLSFRDYLNLKQQFLEINGQIETVRVPVTTSFETSTSATTSSATTTLTQTTYPLNFYCEIGGSAIESSLPEITSEEMPPILEEEGEEGELFVCPVEIPLGNLIDNIVLLNMSLLSKEDQLILWLQQLASAIAKMNELVSHCNARNCEPSSVCQKNPCYGHCDPEDPCVVSCRIQCLECLGQCSGRPCSGLGGEIDGLKEIASTTEEIKKIEDYLFAFLNESRQVFIDVANISTTTPTENIGLFNVTFLKDIKNGLDLCRGFLNKKGEYEDWMLVDCPTAVAFGATGPGGGIIVDCHPQNFFCCRSVGQGVIVDASIFSKSLQSRHIPYYGQLKDVPIADDGVPCLKQSDPLWAEKRYGTLPHCTSYKSGACGPTSLAMILSKLENRSNNPYPVPVIGEEVVSAGGRDPYCPHGTYAPSLLTVATSYSHNQKGYKLPNVPFEQWKEEVKKCFKEKNGLMIGYVQYPLTSSDGGHFIALTGFYKDPTTGAENDNYIVVHDTIGQRYGETIPCPRILPMKLLYDARRHGTESGYCIYP